MTPAQQIQETGEQYMAGLITWQELCDRLPSYCRPEILRPNGFLRIFDYRALSDYLVRR